MGSTYAAHKKAQVAPAARRQRSDRRAGAATGSLRRENAPAASRRSGTLRQRPLGRKRPLAAYCATDGSTREIVLRAGADHSSLLVDCDARSGADARLIAHLAADEPAQNARLLCRRYLEDPTRGRCRALQQEDLRQPPSEMQSPDPGDGRSPTGTWRLSVAGRAYEIRPCMQGGARPTARWCELSSAAGPGAARGVDQARPLSLRSLLAAVQSYRPVLQLTRSYLAHHAGESAVALSALAGELERAERSPVLLNRALRERVLDAIGRGDLTLNEIAMRCGRIKRDRRGRLSGETSWLARRLGLSSEGSDGRVSQWIHSDVLALIARSGLGIDPREVELN